MINKRRFGSQLRNERETRNLTLKQVSGKSGLSISYLSDIENGRTVPSIEALFNLTAAYGEQLSIGWRREGAAIHDLLCAEPVDMPLICRACGEPMIWNGDEQDVEADGVTIPVPIYRCRNRNCNAGLSQ